MKPASYAPVYAALYHGFAEVARAHGWALAVHGSLQRDFDVVAIPWIEDAADPEVVLEHLAKRFALRVIGEGTPKPHGRVTWTLSIGFGECAADLSFMPRAPFEAKDPWVDYDPDEDA